MICRALEAFQSEEDWLLENRDEIEQKIDRGLAQFERGEFFSSEESRADIDERKAAWLHEHRG